MPIAELLASPNTAYLLLVAGLLALLFELIYPGQMVPGVVGVILIVVGLYLLGNLAVSTTGILLLVIGFIMLVAELLAPGFGGFGISGVISFGLGTYVLSSSGEANSVSPVVGAGTVGVLAFFSWLAWRAVRGTYRRANKLDQLRLVGRQGTARTALQPNGFVYYEGELWQARSTEGTIAAGEAVTVVEVSGMLLLVKRATLEGDGRRIQC